MKLALASLTLVVAGLSTGALHAQTLGSTKDTILSLEELWFSTPPNWMSMQTVAKRVDTGSDWGSTSVGVRVSVDATPEAGGSLWFYGGKIGIGTSKPTAALDVAGGIRANGLTLGVEGQTAQNEFRSFGRLLIQSTELLYLNAANNSAPVVVGGGGSPVNLIVTGDLSVARKITTGTLELTSDMNVKSGFVAVDTSEVLDRLTKMPLSTWWYTNNPSVPHIGPKAQDFYAAFKVGEDDKHIGVVDGLGVAFAGIQGLNRKVEAKDAEIAELQHELVSLVRELAVTKSQVAELLAAVEKAASNEVIPAVHRGPSTVSRRVALVTAAAPSDR